jgi:hypothetical protein
MRETVNRIECIKGRLKRKVWNYFTRIKILQKKIQDFLFELMQLQIRKKVKDKEL